MENQKTPRKEDAEDDTFLNLQENYGSFYKTLRKHTNSFSSDEDDNFQSSHEKFQSKTVGTDLGSYHRRVLENIKSTTDELEKKIINVETLLKSQRNEETTDVFSRLSSEHLRQNQLPPSSDDEPTKDIPTTRRKKRKNFLRKNIKLAATAMPLTDEDKRRLEELLKTEEHTEEKPNLINAFRLCEDAENRIGEIDVQLQSFAEETQQASGDLVDSFWKSLILEQMMTEIDKKLAALKEQDEAERNEQVGEN